MMMGNRKETGNQSLAEGLSGQVRLQCFRVLRKSHEESKAKDPVKGKVSIRQTLELKHRHWD